MGRLTTHVLDMTRGCPAAAVQMKLYRVHGDALRLVARSITNSDGRCDHPLLEGDDYQTGVYQLQYEAGAYYRGQGVVLEGQAFLDEVVLRFGIDAGEPHYHVPLLLSPYSYSTYRGS